MNARILYVLTWVFLNFSSYAQFNLVQNSSFETYTACPNSWNLGNPQPDVINVTGWYSAAQSCEYFNSCANITIPGIGVPNNATGNQAAFDGTGYVGFGIKFGGNDAEAIGSQLLTPLIPNQKYKVSFRVCLSDNSSFATFGINKIGAWFTTKKIVYPNNSIYTTPQVYTNQIITDRVNWTEISGCFTADSAYNYISIGHFFIANTTDTTNLYNINYPISQQLAYYLVDYVNLYKDTLGECLTSVEEIDDWQNSIHIYPNPSSKILYLESEQNNFLNSKLEIINSIGQTVLKTEFKNQIDVSELASGFYTLLLKDDSGSVISKKFVKE